MTKDTDIVDDIFARVKAVLGDDFKGQIVVKLAQEELRIRQDWGGTEHYIVKNRQFKKKKEQAKEELRRGAKICDVVRETGISRSLIYQMLKRR
jgi:Mor family transcriptional regulator